MALTAKELLERARQKASSTSSPATPAPQTSVPSIGNLATNKPSFDNLLDSARAMAGMQTTRDKFDMMSDPAASAHSQVKAKIEQISGMIETNNPGLPRIVVEIRMLVKQNGGLAYELTPAEIGEISRGIFKAKGVMMAAKAATKKGARASSVSSSDLAGLLGSLGL